MSVRSATLLFVCLGFFPVLAAAATHDDVAATAAAHARDQPVASPAATIPPKTAVIGRTVEYGELGGSPLKGYLAKPASASGNLPGLIVIHEWWGLNDNIRATADRLAAEGYVALAVDLYGGESAETPKQAMGLMESLNQDQPAADSNLRQAYEYLDQEAGAPRIGVIGWCLGGRWSLHTALLMPDRIDAMVMYYGAVVTDRTQLATLEMPVMGNFAENDPIIPLDEVGAFTDTLTSLGKVVDVKIYPGAKHAFANPSGLAYNAEAADDAWARSITFFEANLR